MPEDYGPKISGYVQDNVEDAYFALRPFDKETMTAFQQGEKWRNELKEKTQMDNIPDGVRHATLMRELANKFYGMAPENLPEPLRRKASAMIAKAIGWGHEATGMLGAIGQKIQDPDYNMDNAFASTNMDLHNNAQALKDWEQDPMKPLDDYIREHVVPRMKLKSHPLFNNPELEGWFTYIGKN